jgi:hypothetical protein
MPDIEQTNFAISTDFMGAIHFLHLRIWFVHNSNQELVNARYPIRIESGLLKGTR